MATHDPESDVLNLGLAPELREEAEKAAEAEGKTLNDWIRAGVQSRVQSVDHKRSASPGRLTVEEWSSLSDDEKIGLLKEDPGIYRKISGRA